MRYLLQSLRSYPTSHMEQESNQVAHCAQHSSDPFVWHEECPSVIQRVLLDHRCIPFWHSCFPCLLFSLSLSLSHNFYHELSHIEVTKFAVHLLSWSFN